jgi:hypothetical protein
VESYKTRKAFPRKRWAGVLASDLNSLVTAMEGPEPQLVTGKEEMLYKTVVELKRVSWSLLLLFLLSVK